MFLCFKVLMLCVMCSMLCERCCNSSLFILKYKNMATNRQERVNSLLIQYLGEIINREIEFPEGIFITIVKVETSSDMKHAKVWISVLPDKYRGAALSVLHKKKKIIQQNLNKKITMKFFPKIEFSVDTTEEYAAGIEALLDEIKKEL